MARLNEKLQRPAIWFFLVAVLMEVGVMGSLLLSGGDAKLSLASEQSGVPLKTDYLSSASASTRCAIYFSSNFTRGTATTDTDDRCSYYEERSRSNEKELIN